MIGDVPITNSQAALLLWLKLLRAGWRLSLNDDGSLYVVVGDDVPHLTQDDVWDQIGRLMPDLILLVSPPSPTASTVH